MKKLLIILFILPCWLFGQERIVLQSGEEYDAKILKITSTEIEFKKTDYLDGPTFVTPKTDVFMIVYSNGEKELFNKINNNEKKNAWSYYDRGKQNIQFGWFFSILGASVAGVELGRMISGSYSELYIRNILFLSTGLQASAAGIFIIYFGGRKKIHRAVEIYNEDLLSKKNKNLDFGLILDNDGLGLAIKF